MNNALTDIIDYHQATKHHLDRYARSLGYLDWATQPDPFRRFAGATLHRLDLIDPAGQPYYDAIFDPRRTPARPIDRADVSPLFFDSMALSAWKESSGNRWTLRCNPSSGNLHPTKGYLIAPPIDGLTGEPGLYHYSPHEHGLEKRATFDGYAFCARHWAGSCWPRPPLFQNPLGQSLETPERSQLRRLCGTPAHEIHSFYVGLEPIAKADPVQGLAGSSLSHRAC